MNLPYLLQSAMPVAIIMSSGSKFHIPIACSVNKYFLLFNPDSTLHHIHAVYLSFSILGERERSLMSPLAIFFFC